MAPTATPRTESGAAVTTNLNERKLVLSVRVSSTWATSNVHRSLGTLYRSLAAIDHKKRPRPEVRRAEATRTKPGYKGARLGIRQNANHARGRLFRRRSAGKRHKPV